MRKASKILQAGSIAALLLVASVWPASATEASSDSRQAEIAYLRPGGDPEAARKAIDDLDIQAPVIITWAWDGSRYYVNQYYECQFDDDEVPPGGVNYRGPAWPIDMISNADCNRRAWLHENADKTGHDICIGPRVGPKKISAAYHYPMVLTVGSVKPCP